jgi:hypothetical protein
MSDGYLVVPGAVARTSRQAALRAVNHAIGEAYEHPSSAESADGSDRPDLRGDATISALLRSTSVLEAAAALVGAPLEPWGLPQIALRFPARDRAREPHGPVHIDGVPVPGAGLPIGGKRLFGFTILAGIFLSNVEEAGHGAGTPQSRRLTSPEIASMLAE